MWSCPSISIYSSASQRKVTLPWWCRRSSWRLYDGCFPPLAKSVRNGATSVVRRSLSETLLAAALLRLQCVECAQAYRQTALHSSQSGQARVGGEPGPMEVEQLPVVCLPRDRGCNC